MKLRVVNTLILILLLMLGLAGGYALVAKADPPWIMALHRIGGWGLIALIPWKVGISWASIKRGLKPNFDRGAMIWISVIMAGITIGVLIVAPQWAWRLGPELGWLRQSAIAWHWMIGIAVFPLGALHIYQRWPKPKLKEFTDRRGVLRVGALAGAALGLWAIGEVAADLRDDPEHPHRHTGSREAQSFSGNYFPITNTLKESGFRVDPSNWRLALTGAFNQPLELDYDQLLALPRSSMSVTLDCTSGWYSTQLWSGPSMELLLKMGQMHPDALAVLLISASGHYQQLLPLADARQALLATHVGDEVLAHYHGFPLRAVLPGWRGTDWVKWIREIHVLARAT